MKCTEMKEMKYQSNEKREVLSTGFCFGLLYFILNLGTHPTAYIKIPENHRYYKKRIEETEIYVHGGLSYSGNYLYIENNQKIEGWFIGWDYARWGDYMGYEEKLPMELRGGKKWTVEELYEEVREACYQIQKMKGKKYI